MSLGWLQHRPPYRAAGHLPRGCAAPCPSHGEHTRHLHGGIGTWRIQGLPDASCAPLHGVGKAPQRGPLSSSSGQENKGSKSGKARAAGLWQRLKPVATREGRPPVGRAASAGQWGGGLRQRVGTEQAGSAHQTRGRRTDFNATCYLVWPPGAQESQPATGDRGAGHPGPTCVAASPAGSDRVGGSPPFPGRASSDSLLCTARWPLDSRVPGDQSNALFFCPRQEVGRNPGPRGQLAAKGISLCMRTRHATVSQQGGLPALPPGPQSGEGSPESCSLMFCLSQQKSCWTTQGSLLNWSLLLPNKFP